MKSAHEIRRAATRTPAGMLPFVVLPVVGLLILHDPERINHDVRRDRPGAGRAS